MSPRRRGFHLTAPFVGRNTHRIQASARANLRAWLRSAESLWPDIAVDRLLSGVDVEEVMDWITFDRTFREALDEPLGRAFVLGAKAGADQLPTPVRKDQTQRVQDVVRRLTFADQPPVEWLDAYLRTVIVQVENTTVGAVRTLVRNVVTRGVSVDVAATTLRDAGIGLDSRSAQASMNRMLREYTKLAEAHPGWPEERLVKAAQRRTRPYIRQLREQRAYRIARTEVMRAVNAGKQWSWTEARDQGMIDARATKTWLTGGNPCPICSGIEGETVGLNDTFAGGYMYPPIHPNCGCEIFLTNV